MLRFLADEDLDGQIVRALRRHLPGLDLLRVQDVGLTGHDDPEILDWAARAGHVVISRDRNTMTSAAYARIVRGLPTPGLLVVKERCELSAVIQSVELMQQISAVDEWADKVTYIPL